LAGIVFALLYGAALVLLRLSFPDGITQRTAWLGDRAASVSIAAHLVAYCGIAFLWFIGVLRSRIGAREDRFLSTVFVGSGYLFLAVTFVAGALASALLNLHAQSAGSAPADPAFALGTRTAYELVNLYSVRLAAVFMLSFATLGLPPAGACPTTVPRPATARPSPRPSQPATTSAWRAEISGPRSSSSRAGPTFSATYRAPMTARTRS
jgi:hypothetical protein